MHIIPTYASPDKNCCRFKNTLLQNKFPCCYLKRSDEIIDMTCARSLSKHEDGIIINDVDDRC